MRPVELADRRDDGSSGERLFLSVSRTNSDGPGRGLVVPLRAENLGVPPHVRLDCVLGHHAFEVDLKLRLLREELGPLIARLEAVTVKVIADVDACTRIGVLPPGATDAGVLLHDREGDPCFLEPDPGEQPRLTAADDDDGKRVARRRIERNMHLARVGAVELHLFEQHRHVLTRHFLTHEPRHHLVQQLGRNRLGFGTAAVSIVADHVERERAYLGLGRFTHVALHLVEEQAFGLEPTADDLRVVRHVDHRHHERRDAHVEQRLSDLRVRRVERFTGVGIAHTNSSIVAGSAHLTSLRPGTVHNTRRRQPRPPPPTRTKYAR